MPRPDLLRRFACGACRLVLALVVSLCLIPAASARDLTEGEKPALAETVASFDAAMRAGDMQRVTATIPPKLLAAVAQQFGVTVEQTLEGLAQQMKEAMATVTLVSFSMNLEAATHKQLEDGTPYVLIPTETVIDAGSGKIRALSDTLALLDEGAWYLLRIDASMLPLLRQVYPGFADVELKPGTMEAVEE